MRFIIDRELFAPQSWQESKALLRFLSLAAEDLELHAIQTDPAYVPGQDNGEIDAWLSTHPPYEATELRHLLENGNVVGETRSSGVANVDPSPLPHQPTPLPRWRFAGTFDIRVERRAESEWGALRLTTNDAADLLREPVHLVLENEFNDLSFVFHLAGSTLGQKLRDMHKAAGRLNVHGGGGGQAKKWLETLVEGLPNAEKWRRMLRTWVLFDQDAGEQDTREPSNAAKDMMRACENVHAAFPVGLSWICLCRREIESYIPDAGLRRGLTQARTAMVNQIIVWRANPVLAPYAWAFDLKKGLRGDLRVNLSQADRDAVKQGTLPLDASMLKDPFCTLTPTEVTALDAGFGKSHLNESLSATPALSWTADIPDEYDRGPAGQAPRAALIQSLFDRM